MAVLEIDNLHEVNIPACFFVESGTSALWA